MIRRLKGLADKHKTILLLSLVLLTYFIFGLQHLSQFETADEHYWTNEPYNGRIHQYWKGILKQEWGMTFINDKPGISLAYVAGPVLPWAEEVRGEGIFEEASGYRVYDPVRAEKLNWIFRLPILVFNGMSALAIFWLIRRLTNNNWVAIWSIVFMLLSPILLGISQIINPDSVFWVFMTLTILAWLVFLQTERWRFAWLTGLFFGLTLLTKYVGIILLPFLFFLMLIRPWYFLSDSAEKLKISVLRLLGGYWSAVLSGSALMLLLFPALLVEPSLIRRTIFDLPGTLVSTIGVGIASLFTAVLAYSGNGRLFKKIIEKTQLVRKYLPRAFYAALLLTIVFVIANWIADQGINRGIRIIPFDTGEGGQFAKRMFYEKFILEVFPITFSLIPLVLGLWIVGLWRAIRGKGTEEFLKMVCISFMITFFLAVVLQELYITPRYGIALYPFISILAAIALFELTDGPNFKRFSKTLVTLVIMAVSLVSLWSIRPFYFNYSNFLLHKKKMIADAWGYGGYEAAQFLNKLPGAENLAIWVDYNGACPFLKGKCLKGRQDFKTFKRGGEVKPDYFIKTRRGSILYETEWWDIKNYYVEEGAKPIWRMTIGGKEGNYVEIYKARDNYEVVDSYEKLKEPDDWGR